MDLRCTTMQQKGMEEFVLECRSIDTLTVCDCYNDLALRAKVAAHGIPMDIVKGECTDDGAFGLFDLF